MRPGNSRRRWMLWRSSVVPALRRRGSARRLAAATASWTARLIPTPPTGDIACAASPNAQETGPPPLLQAVARDRQKLHVIPLGQLADSIPHEGSGRRDPIAEGVETLGLEGVEAALRDDESALEIIPAIEHHKDLAGVEPTERLLRIVRPPRQPHPEHVHRRTKILDG